MEELQKCNLWESEEFRKTFDKYNNTKKSLWGELMCDAAFEKIVGVEGPQKWPSDAHGRGKHWIQKQMSQMRNSLLYSEWKWSSTRMWILPKTRKPT